MIVPVAKKATAVSAKDVALEPAFLPGKGRTHTAQAVGMGEADLKVGIKTSLAEKIMHFFERGRGGDR